MSRSRATKYRYRWKHITQQRCNDVTEDICIHISYTLNRLHLPCSIFCILHTLISTYFDATFHPELPHQSMHKTLPNHSVFFLRTTLDTTLGNAEIYKICVVFIGMCKSLELALRALSEVLAVFCR